MRRAFQDSVMFRSLDVGLRREAGEASKDGAARCHWRAEQEETELGCTLIAFSTKGQGHVRKERRTL